MVENQLVRTLVFVVLFVAYTGGAVFNLRSERPDMTTFSLGYWVLGLLLIISAPVILGYLVG